MWIHMMQLGPWVDLKGGRLQLNSLDHLKMQCSGGSWWPSSRGAGEGFLPWVPRYGFTSTCLLAQRASGLPAPLWNGKFLWLKSCQVHLLSLTHNLWGCILGNDFYWEPLRVSHLALTAFNGKRVRCEENKAGPKKIIIIINQKQKPAKQIDSFAYQ